ncbi:MAG: hypothetical protein Q4D03_02425 [Bacteroidales bacterium]|nr:hypothetical protein [Bacteroidales bacterium]MDO4217013.1 hypothetical protein [Bacteroidales bacterium]
MKRTVIVMMMICFAGIGLRVQAQSTAVDCDALILPRYNNDSTVLEMLVPEKYEWLCTYAHNALYLTNTAPRDAAVHNISELRCYATNQKLPDNYVVDLNSFSVYAYNFSDFFYQHNGREVYFRVGNEGNQYLVARAPSEALKMADDAVAAGNGIGGGHATEQR